MYAIISRQIKQSQRAEINENILSDIKKNDIIQEEVYNTYTGLGGLHNLNQSDFENYYEYAQAKKEFELGQFFTPHELCRDIVNMLTPLNSEMVLDMCCGMGNFFNFLPNHSNVYGFDIDVNAVNVARYLYPDANISQCDIQHYDPGLRFDMIVGNPPFNLSFENQLSQFYYLKKAHSVLNPGGFLAMIVPTSFIQNEEWEKRKVATINSNFSFIGQMKLDPNAFACVGVDNFDTKLMIFVRESEHLEMKPYCAEEFITSEILRKRINVAKEINVKLKVKLMRERNLLNKKELEAFEYKVRKYLYELKVQPHLNKYLNRSIALVTKLQNQKPPQEYTHEQFKDWEKKKLTTTQVLNVLHKYISNQNVVPRKEIALVKTSYSFKLKEYFPHMLRNVKHRQTSINDLITEQAQLPTLNEYSEANLTQIKLAEKFIRKKKRAFEQQSLKFSEMEQDNALSQHLNLATFRNKDGEICHFTNLQKHDLNHVLQKRYSLLNWQQGSGKTAAVYHVAKYLLKYNKIRNAIVIAPAIATNITWESFFNVNRERYIMIRRVSDLDNVQPGVFIVISITMLSRLQKYISKFLKIHSKKICLIFDESDEITNPAAQRTKIILNLFRRAKYKILDTGTTTRNNINELYSQIELLYNNSVNMICWCNERYYQNKDKEIEGTNNEYYGEPFPAFSGANLFRSCFSPAKSSVFGIEKQNQDIYNKDELFDLIEKTIITRKFRDFAGEKYKIVTHNVKPSEDEYEVYRVIMQEFCRIYEKYYNNTGDAKKEAGLRLMRQIKLLIKACSVPNLIDGYSGNKYPSKVLDIGSFIKITPGKVAVGCTSLDALNMYEKYCKAKFPDRPIFIIRAKGDPGFKKRKKITEAFDKSINGILISTQQSLPSSINIPSCNDIAVEALQWNLSKIEQYYFRFIRLDSKDDKRIHFFMYTDSIEQNLIALILTKERLNEFIRSGEVKSQSAIFEEFNITISIIESLLMREFDKEGKVHITWGSQRIAS